MARPKDSGRVIRCASVRGLFLAALGLGCGGSGSGAVDAGGLVVDAGESVADCGEQNILFASDFESGPPTYGFAERYPLTGRQGSVEHFSETHMAGVSYDGSAASRLVAFQDHEQFRMGWFWSGEGPDGGWTWGDEIYVRFRIRFDESYRWDGTGSQQNKMLDIGGGDNARFILHNERDRPSTPCGLGYVDYDQPGNPVFNTAEDFGLPADAFDGGDWGAFSMKNGIDFPCTPPVAVTHGVWYHVQVAVRLSGAAGQPDGFFKLWINQNDPLAPSSEALAIVRELGEWNSSWDFGGYWTNLNALRDSSWLVDDVEVATTFDCEWAPAGSEPARTLQ